MRPCQTLPTPGWGPGNRCLASLSCLIVWQFQQVIEELLLVEACSEQAEWAGLVVYLPL